MPATDGNILLTANAQTCSVPVPSWGYRTVVQLPWDIVELDTGALAIYDHGATATPVTAYDVRVCECTILMSVAQMTTFQAWYSDAAKGRGRDTAMEMVANSGFFPFGPDKGDAGPFTVSLEMDVHPSIGESPYLYFPVTLRMTNTGAWPAYVLPDQVSEGAMTIGTVTKCRFPPAWFTVDGRYGAYVSHTQSGASSWTDKGSGGDWWRSKCTMVSNESKAAAVINYITGTSRATAFALTTAANSHAFGFDKGSSGTYSVRLIQDTIEITHRRHNEFKYALALEYLSGPA